MLHACPVPYFKKILFDHSIPSEEIESFMSCRKTPLPSIIALLFHTLTGPAGSISLYYAFCFHSFLPEGVHWFLFVFRKTSSIILHCWPIPYCWRDWFPCFLSQHYSTILWAGFAYFLATYYCTLLHFWIRLLIFQNCLYHPALLCHSVPLETWYSTLRPSFTPLGRGLFSFCFSEIFSRY